MEKKSIEKMSSKKIYKNIAALIRILCVVHVQISPSFHNEMKKNLLWPLESELTRIPIQTLTILYFSLCNGMKLKKKSFFLAIAAS